MVVIDLVQRVIVVLVRRVVASSQYDICLSSLSSWCEDNSDEQSISNQRQKFKSIVVNMPKQLESYVF